MPDNEGVQEAVRDNGPEEQGADPQAAAGTEDGREGPEKPAEEAAAADRTVNRDGSDDPLDERTPVAELEAERDRLKDQHLRLAADFDNFRKRTEDRLRQRWQRAQADLVARFLEPLDDLRRVTALEPESTASVDAIVEGVDLVERKFFRALEEAGVEVVDPEGEGFDPNTMEAMMRVPAESEADDDTVASVFQRGYTLKGMLIRPARVSVFKAD